MSTCQPSSASARVNASPMRLAPPVTIAVRGLPNSGVMFRAIDPVERAGNRAYLCDDVQTADRPIFRRTDRPRRPWQRRRSEEHTSELQSLMRTPYAVFCLKKKKYSIKPNN